MDILLFGWHGGSLDHSVKIASTGAAGARVNLNQWAIKWGIPFEAVEDLRRELGAINTDPEIVDGESEGAVQTRRRLAASQVGGRLWRNNVGAYRAENGAQVRYGLANESKKMNKIIKSSDLIGITRVKITPDMVGKTLGVFTAEECKREGWVYTATPEEVAQLRYLSLVIALDGIAGFVSKGSTK